MRSTTPTPETPPAITAPPKPLAFQAKSSSPLGITLIVVAFVHLLVIVLLLSHFGWFGISDPEADSDATAGDSATCARDTITRSCPYRLFICTRT
jgi:hypothetical protein